MILLSACRQESSKSTGYSETPNILFIAIEDFNPEHLGCYGGKALTPNIDRLASEGVLFANAFVDGAVCNPSRTALLTGLRPATSGVYGNSDKWQELALPKTGFTLPQHFMNNGYETAKIGKMFHYKMEHDESWNRILAVDNDQGKILSSFHADVTPLLDELENDKSKGWFNENLQWGPVDCEPEEFRDGSYVASVRDYFLEEHENPFFLGVGFHAPHVKFAAPKQFFDLYDLEDIILPENPPDDLLDIPVKLDKNPVHDVMDSTQWREIKRAQFACISYVDWCIGKVLDALEESRLDGNTIVVIWTDHGFGLGEHFQWSKGGNKLFSEINQVACIWKVPGLTPKGMVSNSVVETIDFFPTMFELCHIEIPSFVQGESFAAALKDPSAKIKDAAFTWGSRQRVSVQTERYRFNMNRDLDPAYFELYDHKYDPGEFLNLGCNPQYQETIQTLISYYHEHTKKYELFENE
jgi:uncharacterized sulfatase